MVILLLAAGLFLIAGAGCQVDEGLEGQMRLATPAEWTERADGLPNFQDHYTFEYPQDQLVIVELGLAHQAVGTGQAEVGVW